MDILIVKSAALGDVLRTTGLLAPLRRRYPGCRIVWLTSAAAAPLLAGNPLISRVLTRPGRRAGRFDLVLSLEENLALASFAARASSLSRGALIGLYPKDGRLAYTETSRLYYDMSLLNRGEDGSLARADALKAANRLSYAELWLKILKLPSGPAARSRLFLFPRERKAAERFIPSIGAVGFNPGAGARWPSKQLSIPKARRLLAQLLRLGRPVLLLGGREEAARNKKIGRGTAAVIVPARPLREFAAIVDLCAAVVTTDSLAFHIAAALGKAVVALVGPTSSAELDVFGRGTKISPPSGCACFYRARCRSARHCLNEIPDKSVADAVRRCLG